MRVLSGIIIAILLTQNIIYGEELEIDIVTIPEKLVNNSRAMLIIHYKDQMLPFTPEIESILSSNRTVIDINTNTLRSIGNNLVVDLDLINNGRASITVIPKSGKAVSKTFEVYESNNAIKMLMKVLPSSFSYLGPSSGYISIQLLNAANMPIKAEKDYRIELSSSNDNIVSLDDIIIKGGEYFAIKKFNVKGYGDATIKARYNDLVAEAKIKVIGYNSTIKLYLAPQIAPAMKGQRIYAFIQLQDTNGTPVYAENDMKIDLHASTNDIITSPITIKKGESLGIGELIINTDNSCSNVNIDLSSRSDFNPCIEIYAIADGLKSESVLLELREYTNDQYIQEVNSIEDPKPKIIPILEPSNMPIIADGREKVIGVIQLMSYEGDQFDLARAKPVVPTHSIVIENSNEELVDLRDIVIEKPYSTALVKAKTGYLAGDGKVELFGDNLDNSIIDIKLYGHKDVKIVAEPLIDKIVKGTSFPYLIYFIDREGITSYALSDLNMLISMSNEIVSIEPKNIKRGSDLTLFNAIALEEGSSEITFEGVSTLGYIETISSITILGERSDIELGIEDRLVKNSKGLASIQLLDSSGLPTVAERDLDVYLYASNKLLNLPKMVTIPAGEYYTLFPIESYNSTGIVEVSVFVDGFEPISKSIEIVDDNIKLVMESSDLIINKELTLTLKVFYKEEPLVDANVRWENSKGLPLEYDTSTDNDGIARAKYLITEEGEHVFKAKVSYKGLEREAELRLNSRVSNITEVISYANQTIAENNTSTAIESPKDEVEPSIDMRYQLKEIERYIDIKYLLIIPAIAGIALSIIRKRSKP